MREGIDEYGIDREQAQALFEAYLRDTAGDRSAQLSNLKLADGRWQAAVVGSERSLGSVFLNQHTGRVVVGHTSAEGPAEHFPTEEAAFRHTFYSAADAPELTPNQTVAYPSSTERAEREGELTGSGPQTLKFRDRTGHRSQPPEHEPHSRG